MKVFVKTFTAAALISLASLAMATERSASNPDNVSVNLSTADFALQHYVAVMTTGESAGLEQLFAPDFNQKIQASTTLSYGRRAVIESLKKQQGEIMNCKTSIKIVEKSAAYMIAKIVLKFDSFSMTDLVTLVYDNGIWQVSKSIHSYQ
ncbi:MAG: nuclear transport factor 2 family protein [Sphingobacterium sp.]|jgi:hypothetical protein|nr:nuclear transport factor 2 family protein [Sphingobacterium sp.]